MAIIHNYAIWNNKGGVGKSTITFHIASRYAETHPDEDVLVLDMCPQANVSMMLLGGGINGEQNVLQNCSQATPKTVVGYITDILTNGQGAQRATPMNYISTVNVSNPNLPANMYLLCGDGNLEIIAPGIASISAQQPMAQHHQPWVWVHNVIRNFILDFSAVSEANGRNLSVFIDTNPSFGIYTEIAIVAADKLICPVNADDSSRTAASAMAILLHGSNPPHPVYASWSFALKANTYQINVPLIHLIVGNRFTQYVGAAAAYRALSDATAAQLYNIYQANPGYFSPLQNNINNVDDFRTNYSVYLRDFNTTGVVAANQGALMSQMRTGNYQVYAENVLLDQRRINECIGAIDDVINKL